MNYKRYFAVVLIASIAFVAMIRLGAPQVPKKQSGRVEKYGAGNLAFVKPLIDTGTEAETIVYYSQVGSFLSLPLIVQGSAGSPTLNPQFGLDQLIGFGGFSDGQGGGLLAKDLDSIAGSIINTPGSLAGAVSNVAKFNAFFSQALEPGEIVAASYFAPKIANVGQITGAAGSPPEPQQYGWRKVIRLRPRTGSPANSKAIIGIWILFNYFTPVNASTTPNLILQNSVNTQVILQFATVQNTPSLNPAQPNPIRDAAYWLDFNPTQKGALLTNALNASFDSGEGDIGGDGTQNYYVPTACAVCHGGGRESAALNFLDTDHWFERVRSGSPAGTDFPSFGNVNGVLLDGGADQTKPAFAVAFAVFQTLNSDIKGQNAVAGATLQQAGAQHWIDAHAHQITPLSLAQRALGANPWTVADSPLLSYLDRYCYRCHNAIDYDVFSKQDVLFERPGMIKRIQLDWIPANFQRVMPQDRHLDATIIQQIATLLNNVN
jgi:hypothetical protein